MIWRVEYLSGKTLDESIVSFSEIDKNGIKRIYFFDESRNKYGIDFVKNVFFVNNKNIDIKLDGEITNIIQYKNAKYNLYNHSNFINSWNIGIELLGNFGVEKYILSVMYNKLVFMEAHRFVGTEKEEIKTISL